MDLQVCYNKLCWALENNSEVQSLFLSEITTFWAIYNQSCILLSTYNVTYKLYFPMHCACFLLWPSAYISDCALYRTSCSGSIKFSGWTCPQPFLTWKSLSKIRPIYTWIYDFVPSPKFLSNYFDVASVMYSIHSHQQLRILMKGVRDSHVTPDPCIGEHWWKQAENSPTCIQQVSLETWCKMVVLEIPFQGLNLKNKANHFSCFSAWLYK